MVLVYLPIHLPQESTKSGPISIIPKPEFSGHFERISLLNYPHFWGWPRLRSCNHWRLHPKLRMAHPTKMTPPSLISAPTIFLWEGNHRKTWTTNACLAILHTCQDMERSRGLTRRFHCRKVAVLNILTLPQVAHRFHCCRSPPCCIPQHFSLLVAPGNLGPANPWRLKIFKAQLSKWFALNEP